MLYNPKFCCECGEKIERPDRKFWTSRRFCELCETDFVLTEWLGKAAVSAGLLFGIIYLGAAFLPSDVEKQRAANAEVMPSNRSTGIRGDIDSNKTATREDTTFSLNANASAAVPNVSKNPRPALEQNTATVSKQTSSPVAVYFCGAETKKGTPCTRRVKGGGRCWQHVGREAMLPEAKLLASQ
ncbi:MAG: hypothetical protein KIS76_15780 [Pyrinomonadaceae bacterium]|nr:hypothetical protein [Pyrinomonadaceae bacterium]